MATQQYIHVHSCMLRMFFIPLFSDESTDNLAIVMMVCIGVALLIVVITTVAVTYYCVWWGKKKQRNTTV